jgi:hypothetical protein
VFDLDQVMSTFEKEATYRGRDQDFRKTRTTEAMTRHKDFPKKAKKTDKANRNEMSVWSAATRAAICWHQHCPCHHLVLVLLLWYSYSVFGFQNDLP